VTMTIKTSWLRNWRAELVYSPHVIAEIVKFGEYSREEPGGSAAKRRAEQIAAMRSGVETNEEPETPLRRLLHFALRLARRTGTAGRQ
jgi:hypothetical protein